MNAGDVRWVLHTNRHGVAHRAQLLAKVRGERWRVWLLSEGSAVVVDVDDVLELADRRLGDKLAVRER